MAFRPSSDMLESDIRSAIDSGNKIEDDVGAKSLAIASSQKVLAGNGAERVKKNKTTTVAMMVAILFHSIGSFMEDPALAEPSFCVIVCTRFCPSDFIYRVQESFLVCRASCGF